MIRSLLRRLRAHRIRPVAAPELAGFRARIVDARGRPVGLVDRQGVLRFDRLPPPTARRIPPEKPRKV